MTDPVLHTSVVTDEETVDIEVNLDGVLMNFGFANDGQDHTGEVMFLAGIAPQVVAAALEQLEAQNA